MNVLPRDFYDRDPIEVARDLLGCVLVHRSKEGLTSGWIVETEAYLHRTDPASHSYRKRTKRIESMFGSPGHAYVYAIHSRWCFNIVTEPEEIASAVLVRAIQPRRGLELMRRRRGRDALLDLCRGPARLCEAFGIDRQMDGFDLCRGRTLGVTQDDGLPMREGDIVRSTRIGVTSGHDLPLRFFVNDSRFVSAHRRPADIGS